MATVRHTGFYVDNLSASVNFFVNLDFEVIYEKTENWENDFGQLSIIKLMDKEKNIIELINNFNQKVDQHDHIALTVTNLQELYTKLQLNGIIFIVDPRLSPDKSVNVAFCKDPSGIIIELVEETNVSKITG